MTQFEADALFDIQDLLRDIKIELKSINRKLDCLTDKGGVQE